MDLGSPLITQAIAVQLLGALGEVRELRRQQLKPRRDLLAALLRTHLGEWKFRPPAGGLFVWVELPDGDAREFAQVALRHGVVILPGPAMPATEGHTRRIPLPFVAGVETLRMGVDRLAAAWRDYTNRRTAGSGSRAWLSCEWKGLGRWLLAGWRFYLERDTGLAPYGQFVVLVCEAAGKRSCGPVYESG